MSPIIACNSAVWAAVVSAAAKEAIALKTKAILETDILFLFSGGDIVMQ